MRNDKKNVIVEKSLDFAVQIIGFCEILENNKRFVVSRQLLRSGTSIGANIREAQNAESKTDFIHKMKIAAKEADETSYWLELCHRANNYPYNESLVTSLNDISLILSKIISTTRKSIKNQYSDKG